MHWRTPQTDDLPFSVRARKVNWVVGMIALFLPFALLATAALPQGCFMFSISHYYYTRIGGDVLVGALSIIGVILIFFYEFKGQEASSEDARQGISRYSAHDSPNWWLAKAAGFFALGVAFFPTGGYGCQYPVAGASDLASRFLLTDTWAAGPVHVLRDAPPQIVGGGVTQDFWMTFGWWTTSDDIPWMLHNAHYLSAALMFTVLGYFSFFVFTRVQSPGATTDGTMDGPLSDEKRARNRVYRAMGVLIFGSILALAVKTGLVEFFYSPEDALAFVRRWDGGRWTFTFEALALVAFGISWMLKGRFLGILGDVRRSDGAGSAAEAGHA